MDWMIEIHFSVKKAISCCVHTRICHYPTDPEGLFFAVKLVEAES
jgi:hypothetical protein